MGAQLDGNELILSGVVGGDPDGDDFWVADGFSASDVIGALAAVGRNSDIAIRLNSPGGKATEGAAIHAALSAHKGKVHIIVEGVAASAASLLAMAADRLTMSPGAVMMIHDPAGFTFGDVTAHQKTIEGLNALGDAYAGIYAEKSGKSVEEAREVMRAETWLTGPQAVAEGFADDLGAANENEPEPVAFAYQVYAKAPERFVALAHARGWKPRASMAAPAAHHRQPEKPTMTKPTEAGDAPKPENNQTPPADPNQAPPADPVADAAAIASICAGFGMSADKIEAFIKGGGTVEQAKARSTEAGEIRAAVAMASKVNPAIKAEKADEFIAQGFSLDKARSALLGDIVANQSQEIAPSAPPPPTASETANSGWEKAVARANARIEG